MLGHKVWQRFRSEFDTYATVRSNYEEYARYGLFDPARLIAGVDAMNFDSVTRALDAVQPNAVVNCIGIVKQLAASRDPIHSISINSLFPHMLADACRQRGARSVHISTDCVFSGRRGLYTEADATDPDDLYGRSKLLGEIEAEGAWTIRTSIIGREIRNTSGLVEWFLSQRGKRVRGFERAFYTGLTTAALAEVIAFGLDKSPKLDGVWHVSSEAISKYDLLCLIRTIYDLDIEIIPDTLYVCDRRLDSSRFRSYTAYEPPSWKQMITAMKNDTSAYDEWRKQ